MKKYQIILSALAMSTAFASCQKEDSGVKPVGKQISVGDISISSSASSRAAETSQFELYPVQDDGNIVEMTETVTDMESPDSRAGAITTDNIKESGFSMDGYVVAPVEGAADFMKGAKVEWNTTANRWVVGNDQCFWYHEMEHYFWAYTGTLQNFTSAATTTPPHSTASFGYTNDGEVDLIMAHTTQHYSETDGVAGHNNTAIQSLAFDHALAGITFGNLTTTFKQKTQTGGIEDAYTGRAYVSNVSIVTYTEGTCAVTNNASNNTFAWTPTTSKITEGKTTDVDREAITIHTPGENPEMHFVIPQAKSGCKLRITVFDTKKLEAKAFYFDIPKSVSTAWEAGKSYTYNLNAIITLEYSPVEVIEGFHFGGSQGWQAMLLMENIYYIKKFTVSWYGSPICQSANPSYAGVTIEPSSRTPKLSAVGKKGPSDYIDGNWKADNPHLGLSLQTRKSNSGTEHYADKIGSQGTYYNDNTQNPPVSITKVVNGLTYYGYCEATFYMDALGFTGEEPFDLWVVWYGQNASDNAYWNMADIKITNIVYR